MDRDENASINILIKGLRFSLDGLVSEAMVSDIRGIIMKNISVDISQDGMVPFVTCQ